MNDPIRNQRSSLVKGLVVLSTVVVLMAGAQPWLWRWVRNRAVDLHELRIQTEQIDEVQKRTKEVQDNYENQKVFVAQLDSVVPQSRNALQVIERLETATQGLGIDLEVSRIDEGAGLAEGLGGGSSEASVPDGTAEKAKADSEEGSAIFPLFITVTAIGRPEALVEYVDAVEHVQELSYIQKFTISPQAARAVGGQEPGGSFQLLMTVVFYLQGKSDGSIQ